MIVVTGPGRSGTSLLANLYRQLGFDPGGHWEPAVTAGFEDGEVVRANLTLAQEMGVSVGERRGGVALQITSGARRRRRAWVPASVRRQIGLAVDRLRYRQVAPDLMNWDSLVTVVERHGEQLRRLAEERSVVKDPRFCWTLRAWLAARAPVSSVVLTVRPLDAMAESRVRVGMYTPRARDWGMHNYCYGLGLLLTAAAEYRVPVTTLRFPDFLADPDELYRVLPLPEARSRQDFLKAFDATYDPTLVHDDR